MVMYAGYQVGLETLEYWQALVFCVLAVAAGASILYGISRRFGVTLIARYGRYVHCPARAHRVGAPDNDALGCAGGHLWTPHPRDADPNHAPRWNPALSLSALRRASPSRRQSGPAFSSRSACGWDLRSSH